MQEQLQTLKELQELDDNINATRRERSVLVAERDRLLAEQAQVKAMVDELQSQIEELREERADLNHSLTREDDNILRAESRLPEIKTQKEYVAVLKEIDTAKKVRKEVLEKMAEKDAEVSALDEERAEKDEAFATLSEEVSARESDISTKLDNHDQEMASRDKDREALLKKLPAQIRKRYQMLLDRRDGSAVVEARDGACLGCNMHLPPQLFNSLFSRKSIESCPHCNRLIYISEEALS